MTESLAGQLLVASPALLDPNFYRTVVYIAEHGEAGALGLVLNRPTDAPVEDLNPFAGIHAFTTRMTAEGEPRGGWFKDQCISRREALHAYTMAGAYAAFEENRLGSLTPGKLADFILLDTDLRTCPPAAILKTRVLWTFVGGHEVYRHE